MKQVFFSETTPVLTILNLHEDDSTTTECFQLTCDKYDTVLYNPWCPLMFETANTPDKYLSVNYIACPIVRAAQ